MQVLSRLMHFAMLQLTVPGQAASAADKSKQQAEKGALEGLKGNIETLQKEITMLVADLDKSAKVLEDQRASHAAELEKVSTMHAKEMLEARKGFEEAEAKIAHLSAQHGEQVKQVLSASQ